MNREESNKIKVNRSTQVGDINGIGIDAEDLQRWAYRRLETWPDLLELAEWVSRGEHHSACEHLKNPMRCNCQVGAANKAIAKTKALR